MHSLSTICSLCVESNSNLQSVLSKDIDGVPIEEKLKVILLELVHFKPNIQKYICSGCLINLNYVYKFRLKCLEKMPALNEHVQKIELQKSWDDIKYKKEDTSPTENHSKSGSCDNETKYPQTMECVFIKEEVNFTEETNQIILPEDVVQVEMTETSGINEKHNQQNNCQTPYEVFKEFNEEKHIVDGNVTSNKNTSTNHHKCQTCTKTFKQLNDLRRHARIHTGEKPFTCDICSKAFTHPSALAIHKTTHQDIRAFHCPVCNKTYAQNSSLRIHMKSHGEKKFCCDLCQFKCFTNAELVLHSRTHSGEKPYLCPVCNKAFKQLAHLTGHKRIHDNIRPYKCSVCDMAFVTGSNLNRHKLTHTGEKPYSCEVCDRKFATKGELKIHNKRKHSDNS